MAERIRKMLTFVEVADRVLTFVMAVPFLRDAISRLSAKGGETIAKTVEKAFGIEEGGKGFNDEILFNKALSAPELSPEEKKEIREFHSKLRIPAGEEKEEDAEKRGNALILAIASIVLVFRKEVKKIDKTDKNKPVEETSMEYDLEPSTTFLKSLLEQKVLNEKEETYKRRVQFLEDNNVFKTFIPPEKKPSPAKKKLGELWQGFKESQQKNLEEMQKKSEEALKRSQEYRKKKEK